MKDGDELIVQGVGLNGFQKPKDVLYCGNSGTTMRLMLGLLSAQPFESVLTGDTSLNKRPMERVMGPLREMGANFKLIEKGGKRLIQVGDFETVGLGDDAKKSSIAKLALSEVEGSLKGIHHKSPVASAQVKTAILLAGLTAEGETSVIEPAQSRNHTELMLKAMGANLSVQGLTVTISQTKELTPIDIDVPGDISSAAFFIVAALITEKSDLVIQNVNLNPTRTGILDVLEEMGADLEISARKAIAGEAVGDLRVRSSLLKGVLIHGDLIPRLIDEIPILALAGAVADGETIVSDAQELRVKESDRIQAICNELKKLGVSIQEQEDGFRIQGTNKKRFTIHNSRLTSYADHRMAMMEIIAGLLAETPIEIDDIDCINTSFPGFFELLNQSCDI